MRKFILIVSVCLSISSLSGQNAMDEYKQTLQLYKNATEFSFDVEVYAYENKTDKKAELVGKGSARKKDECFYSHFGEQEMVYGKGGTVIINNTEKTIDYFGYDNTKHTAERNSFSAVMDTLFFKSNDTSFVYHGLTDGRKHFSLSSPGQVIVRTDIYVNAGSNLISKVIYSYGESTEDYELGVASVVVYYKNTTFKNVSGESFLLDRYVVRQGKSFSASPNYKGYKVVQHSNKKTS